MATKKAGKKEEPSFEKDLERLEAIVSALEEGGLSLDDSLKRFEEGIQLAKRCEKTLTDAEKKIEVLTRNATGELETENFCDEAESAGESGETDDEEDSRESSGGLLF